MGTWKKIVYEEKKKGDNEKEDRNVKCDDIAHNNKKKRIEEESRRIREEKPSNRKARIKAILNNGINVNGINVNGRSSSSTHNIVSSCKKSLNESYSRWSKQDTASIVSSSNDNDDDDVKRKKTKNKNQQQQKEQMMKKKKKKKISDSTCSSKNKRKSKKKKKKKKKEKFAASRTEKPIISNENVIDISSKKNAIDISSKTSDTTATSSSSRTDSFLGNNIDDNEPHRPIEFAVNDRVMKKVKNKTTNATILEGPYVVINYLAAVIEGNDDKVIIRKTSQSSFTMVYETLPVTKIVRYEE